VPEHYAYDYGIIRVVPRVEQGEFLNVGVILSCPGRKYLEARVELDEARLLAIDPSVNRQLIQQNLLTFPTICAGGEDAGPIGGLQQRERFHWLVTPRSTVIQVSPVHAGLCTDPGQVLKHLMDTMVKSIESGFHGNSAQ
jgi:hypothetical protein